MTSMLKLAVAAALASTAAAATTIKVDVGLSGFSFSPNNVTAAVGDILEYHFHPINHSVVMGDFSNPCQPAKTGGFFSGFMAVSSGEGPNVFRVTVNSTDPMVFYCSQNVGSHCKSGMVGIVNANSQQTLDAYKSAAASVSSASNPSSPFGGLVVAASSSSSSTTSASASATPTQSSAPPPCNDSYGSCPPPPSTTTPPATTGGNGAGTVKASLVAILGALGLAVFMA